MVQPLRKLLSGFLCHLELLRTLLSRIGGASGQMNFPGRKSLLPRITSLTLSGQDIPLVPKQLCSGASKLLGKSWTGALRPDCAFIAWHFLCLGLLPIIVPALAHTGSRRLHSTVHNPRSCLFDPVPSPLYAVGRGLARLECRMGSSATTPASSYRGRLAPSPTGYLHVGHARTFWTAYQRAREAGGVLAMRM